MIEGIGLAMHFTECEGKMWLVSPRKLPVGVRFETGSEWMTLHHKFVKYLLTSKDSYLEYLRDYYKHAVMAPEVRDET